MFKCNDGRCIYSTWRCDGDKDCIEGDDEHNCTTIGSTDTNHKTDNIMPTCHDWMFQCSNDKCVPHWWKCDGINDCGDNSDEIGCSVTTNITDIPIVEEPPETDQCLKNQFMCTTFRCISKSYVCDGFPDCPDGEDESNCAKTACGRDKFRCRSDGVCLDRSKYCDGVVNCVDGSDEDDCKKSPWSKRYCLFAWQFIGVEPIFSPLALIFDQSSFFFIQNIAIKRKIYQFAELAISYAITFVFHSPNCVMEKLTVIKRTMRPTALVSFFHHPIL